MSGAGRGVTPGADPDGSDKAPGPPAEAGDDVDASADKTSPDGQAPEAQAEGVAESQAPAGPESDGKRKGARRPRRKRSFWREFPVLVVVALLLAVVIKTYAIQAFFIPSGSMENTLEINDRVLVNKLVYDVRGIHRGDIVVFNGDGSWDPGTVPVDTNFVVKFANGFASMFGFGHPGDILIKRVIGLPGDRVACCDAQDQVTVNGVPLTEQSYLYPGSSPSDSRFSITVPPGRLWVMGDHRLISDDSRDHLGSPGGGTVPESAVVGRAFVIIWPPSRLRFLPIPATFQQPKLNATAAVGPGTACGPAVGSPRAVQSGPAADPRLRRRRPGHLAPAAYPPAARSTTSPRAKGRRRRLD
jgi:signal peptidase I